MQIRHEQGVIDAPVSAWQASLVGISEEARGDWLVERITALVASSAIAVERRAVEDRLRLRLWPASREAQGLVSMPVMPGVALAACLDLPESVVMVTADLLERWGMVPGQLMALGLRNTVKESATEEVLEGPLGAKICMHSGPSVSVAARAVALEHWVKSPHGALVAVPNDHYLIFHELLDERAVAAMQAVWMLAESAYNDAERPISPDLFWWTPGRFMRIEMSRDEETGRIAIQPPAEFSAVMEALRAGAEAE